MSLEKMLKEAEEKDKRDAKIYAEHDEDLCMLCDAHGEDKRSLHIRCFYAIDEVIPEAVSLAKVKDFPDGGYYLRICKSCRASLLGKLGEWREERVALIGRQKDSDGCLENEESCGSGIYVRENGISVEITREEWDRRQAKKKKQNLTT